jgi:hypothetical protein
MIPLKQMTESAQLRWFGQVTSTRHERYSKLPGNAGEGAKRNTPTDLGRRDTEHFQREEELWLETVRDEKVFVYRLQLPVKEVRLREVR